MVLSSRQRRQRSGIILLVVLALITLFASIGVAFVYFSEQEVTKAADQKAGETIKLPDADLMFNYVMRQLIFPTGNTASALITHSMLENLYGRPSNTGVQPTNVSAHNGTGRRGYLYRDGTAPVRDLDLQPLGGNYLYDAAKVGQDEYFRINFQNRLYDEALHGSLNPSYTYPDHRNASLGAVAGNWTDGNGTPHGPVAIARSFAREIKLRIAVIDTSITDPMVSNVVRYHEVVFNPYSSDPIKGLSPLLLTPITSVDFWKLLPDASSTIAQVTDPVGYPTLVPPVPAGSPRATDPIHLIDFKNYYIKRIGALPPLPAPFQYAGTPGVRPFVPNPIGGLGNKAIQCAPDGSDAFIVLDRASSLAHSLRPNPRLHPNFPPPGDLGGDVKNLPPSVKTLVGFSGGAPVFANNDSYWMDVGFPAIPYSNNRKVKPLAAVFIMDNDGKVNLNTAGNLRGSGTGPIPNTGHLSGPGFGPWEINPTKLGIPLAELRAMKSGAQVGSTYIRGSYGFSPDSDPTTATNGYFPLLRGAPYYGLYNADGSNDGQNALTAFLGSNPYQVAGDIATDPLFRRWPFFFSPLAAPYDVNATPLNGYLSGSNAEFTRGGPFLFRSPFFISPYAPTQIGSNALSTGGFSFQRTFSPANQESLYRLDDTGADKLDSDLRKLIPTAFADPRRRWQQTVVSHDLNVAGIAPWKNNTADYSAFRAAATAALDGELTRGAGAPVGMPATSAANGEYSTVANYLWRAVKGGQNRRDLSQQLPDYPLPPNNNTHLDLNDPLVRTQYKLALAARQKLADLLYNDLVDLTHPFDDNTRRWLAQIAVNIVDYVDNDDYPTWFQVGTTATNEFTVWGTELPRLVINEVYCEAINDPSDPLPMNQAQNDYNVRHWVELYNPLMNVGYTGVWPDGANARLNVNGTSAYRLIVTTFNNTTNIRNANNTLGDPNSLTAANTSVVTFPANASVEPSDVNYGTGAQPTAPAPNPGFYLVGPPNQPTGTMPPMNPLEEAAFPTNSYDSTQMEQTGRISRTSGRFNENHADNRQAILLQRLANPYLPFNPVQGEPGHNPTYPYNPYITIDYVRNVRAAHAVQYDTNGNADNDPIDQRNSMGKMQPYAAINEVIVTTPPNPPQPDETVWMAQIPDADKTRANRNPYTSQIQHTFLRQNGVETAFPLTTAPVNQPTNNPTQLANGLANRNTLKLPFDWLVHLDRSPTSPVDLLHISGYRPHELTQQFNRLSQINGTSYTRITPPMPPPAMDALQPGNEVEITATKILLPTALNSNSAFVGTHNGTPYSLKNGDLVYVTWISSAASGNVSEWVVANGINHYTSNTTSTFRAITGAAVTGITGVEVRLIAPFSHYAPWFRSQQYVNSQSTNRIYRLLEKVAVRNPGADVGQYRFTSGIAATTPGNTVNISAPIDPMNNNNSRWIQMDSGAVTGSGIPNVVGPQVSTNDALLILQGGDPGQPIAPDPSPTGTPPFTYNYTGNVGDTLVVNVNQPVNIPLNQIGEQRVTVLEVDTQNSRIRVLLNNLPPAMANAPGSLQLTFDFAYLAGRQPGKINLNTMWDIETFRALADAQLINSFTNTAGVYDDNVDQVFRRIYQQRQPNYFSQARLVGHTGVNGVGEDRPFQGMGVGDISRSHENARQGISNTFLSDRYQEGTAGPAVAPANQRIEDMSAHVPGDELLPNVAFRYTRSLFEVGRPGEAHPFRRWELLSKIWNNSTVRSNTFSVWVTIGFFEYDEATNSLGAEVGQIQGKNTRYRFFAVVDRTSVDSWLKSWNLHAPASAPANINLFADTAMFPSLDARMQTYPLLTKSSAGDATTAISLPGGYSRIGGTTGSSIPGNPASLPGVWVVNVSNTTSNPFEPASNNFSRMVQVQSDAGFETAQMMNNTSIVPPQAPPVANQFYIKLTLNHTGIMTIRPLPVPPTVLHWSQLK